MPAGKLDEVGRLDGGGTVSQGKESLREVMPETAKLVDELRAALGREWADRVVLGGKLGRCTFWAREECPDGQVREFGSRRKGGGHGVR